MQAMTNILRARRPDLAIAAGSVAAVIAAYLLGYLLIDVSGAIAVSNWQSQPEHIGGVRFFIGAAFMALFGIGLSIWANR